MEKVVIIVVLILSTNTTWTQSPEEDGYSLHCEFNIGDTYSNEIWYNDPDGDCITTDWYLQITILETGQVFTGNSNDEDPPLEWDLTDRCCFFAGSGGTFGGSSGGNSSSCHGSFYECIRNAQ